MARYQKKPIQVSAWQFVADKFFGGWQPPWPKGAVMVENDGSGTNVRPYVVTIHGQRAYLEDGDYIIQEPDGEHYYPCKPDIFVRTYDPVAE